MRVQAVGLGKSFGKRRAVDEVSFEIRPGVVTGFLGPNGSGKSTTLRLMLGLDKGDGHTLYDGRPLKSYRDVSRVVGAHLDAKLFHPQRRARAHLRMLAAESHLPDARVEEVIGLMGLQEVARQRPKSFSLGMGQRLGLAGALLGDPQVLLLDEPANGLDPATIHWLRDFLTRYAATGKSVLVSSHLLSEMELLADDLIVIARGRLLANEPAAEFIRRNSRAEVLARVDDVARLKAELEHRGVEAVQEGSWLRVFGVEPDAIGEAAFVAGLRVFELTRQRASLEEAFLKLTNDSQDYETGAVA